VTASKPKKVSAMATANRARARKVRCHVFTLWATG
jgi:hypothetical protein